MSETLSIKFMIAHTPALRRITRDIVSAVVLSADDCVLFGKKDPLKGGVYPDAWHLPGGGTDDQDLVVALERELREEINLASLDGLKVEILDDQGRGSARKVLPSGEAVMCEMKFNVYRVNLSVVSASAPVSPSAELPELRWVPRAELQNFNMTPPCRELLARLGWING